MVLVPQVVDAVAPIPVLAAGGIADGRGLAAALVLGAQGANIGTRFLASPEASASEDWKQAILSTESEDVIRFEVWQEIMPAASAAVYPTVPRVLPSAFINEWRDRPDDARRQAERLRGEIMDAVRQGRVHELAPFAGQTAGMVRDILPAAEIVRRMVDEAERAPRGGVALIA